MNFKGEWESLQGIYTSLYPSREQKGYGLLYNDVLEVLEQIEPWCNACYDTQAKVASYISKAIVMFEDQGEGEYNLKKLLKATSYIPADTIVKPYKKVTPAKETQGADAPKKQEPAADEKSDETPVAPEQPKTEDTKPVEEPKQETPEESKEDIQEEPEKQEDQEESKEEEVE